MVTNSAPAIRRGVSGILVAALVLLLVWCLLAARSVGSQSSYDSWLATHGSRVDVTVVELGETRADGTALQAWVSNPGRTGCRARELFIDLSRGTDVITHESQRFSAVVSCSPNAPLQNPPNGVAASALNHSFVPDYLSRVGPAAVLVLIVIGCIVLLRRFWRP